MKKDTKGKRDNATKKRGQKRRLKGKQAKPTKQFNTNRWFLKQQIMPFWLFLFGKILFFFATSYIAFRSLEMSGVGLDSGNSVPNLAVRGSQGFALQQPAQGYALNQVRLVVQLFF